MTETKQDLVADHKMYMRSSPSYKAIVNRHSHMLSPGAVRGILRDHGLTEEDYTSDPMNPDCILAFTHLAALYAWLGY